MPKFYRQNKKRIDPRYFLNETTNRDLDESAERFTVDQGIKFLSDRLLDMAESGQYINQSETIDTLLKQIDKFKCGRVQVDQSVPSLSPMNIQQLTGLMNDENISRFFEIAAMLSKTNNPGIAAGSDGDDDGISDEKEAALRKVIDSP
tara:strand:- start:75 stop:518 length:444 start_codon:yes stop_codon:yes gene_type:complete